MQIKQVADAKQVCLVYRVLVSSPDPTQEERSDDIRLISQASLTLITFWRESSLRQSHCRKHNLWLQPETLGYFIAMTQHFFWQVN